MCGITVASKNTVRNALSQAKANGLSEVTFKYAWRGEIEELVKEGLKVTYKDLPLPYHHDIIHSINIKVL